MKAYTYQEFLKLPCGTFFSIAYPWGIYYLHIKMETIFDGDKAIDYFFQDFLNIKEKFPKTTLSYEKFQNFLKDMISEKTSYEINESVEKASHVYEAVNEWSFIVFEKMDLQVIKNLIEKYN